MQGSRKSYLEGFRERQKTKRKLRSIGAVGATAAALAVAAALILPGFGESVPGCGLEEHTHTESCEGDSCALTEHTHDDSCYVNLATTEEGEAVNERLVINISPKNGIEEGLAGETLSAKIVSKYSKANDTGEAVFIALKISDLPEGVTLAGFDKDGKQQVTLKGDDDSEQTIILTIKEDYEGEEGQKYIVFEQPQGSTLEFDIQFNSENGIMVAESLVSVEVDETKITGLEGGVGETDSFAEAQELTWTAKNEWDAVDKKVNSVEENEIAVKADNTLSGTLTYTIIANSSNNENVGEIWTDYITVEDTLTLPENISLPTGAVISDDKTAVVTADGTVILSFTELQDGTVESLTISDTGKEISYKLNIPNSYKNDSGVPQQEQENLAVTMVLNAELLVLPENYKSKDATVIAQDAIKNSVAITPVPYHTYTVPSTTDEVTTTPVLLEEKYNFYKYSNAPLAGFGAGDQIGYTFSITNTGETPLPVKDSVGNYYEVTDTLPEYVYLTTTQVNALAAKNASYDEATHTITWIPSTEMIPVGSEVKLNFYVTLKDAKTLDSLGLKKGDKIVNTATYRGKESNESWINYKVAELTITKASIDANGDELVQNGEDVYYSITVSNDTKYDSVALQTITDTLPAGLTFKAMTVGDTVLLDSGNYTIHDSTTACEIEHTGTFTKDGQDLTWEIGCLDAGEEVTVNYVATLDTDKMEGDKTGITNTASIPDGSTDNTIGVDYPIKLDKTVKQDTTVGYENGSIFDYTITASNDAENPSTKEDLVLMDVFGKGLLPYGCTLIRTNLSTNETVEISWEEFSVGEYDTSLYSYQTVVDGRTAVVQKEPDEEEGPDIIKLFWNIGKMAPGEIITISYQGQINMTQEQIDSDKSYKFGNLAWLDEVEKEVYVTGGEMLGSISLTKQFWWNNNLYRDSGIKGTQIFLEDENDERWDLEFVLTGVDAKGNVIVFEDGTTEQVITMRDFVINAHDTYDYSFEKLPIGTYTLLERMPGEVNLEKQNMELSNQTIYPIFGVTKDDGTAEYSSRKCTIEVIENKDVSVWISNDCYAYDKVVLQKSVYELAVEDITTGTWTSLPDKYLFATDNDPNTRNLVVYNITVAATGGWDALILSLKDYLPEGMKFLGVYPKADYPKDSSQFRMDTLLSNQNTLLEPTSLSNSLLALRSAVRVIPDYDEETNEVTFNLQCGSDTIKDSNGKVAYHTLKAGQAFTFLMLCEVEDGIAAGVELTNTAEIQARGCIGGLDESVSFEMANTPYDKKQNNGTAEEISYEDDVWTIQSSVTIVPENTIVPGIEKNATDYILTGKKLKDQIVLEEETNIPPNSAVKWEVKLSNDGTEAMTGYTVEDEVTPEFHFMTEEEAETFLITTPFSYQIFTFDGTPVGEAVDVSQKVWEAIAASGNTSKITLEFPGEEYTIPVGGYGVLSMYTNNTVVNNKIYRNTATLLPEQEFVANKVVKGELTKDANGKYIGVTASDDVYALGEYASVSWKTITEKGDSENTARGTWGKNYISVDLNSEYVTYTNNIRNISANNFQDFVIIDLMPMVNDTGVVNRNDLRGSEFSVHYNGEMKVQVIDKSGNLISEPEYTVEFSSKTGFTQKDFAGNPSVSWHKEWTSEDCSFRVIMGEDFFLSPQETLVISYEGKIDSAAMPGAIAWNSFGYQYSTSANSDSMRAEPPKVGVMIPTVPIIQKEVVDSYDKVQERDAGIEFTFELWDKTANTKLCEFTVCQGGYRELSDLVDTDGNSIILENGKEYTITERTDLMPKDYEFVGIGEKGGTLADSYSFIYHNNKDINILARNKIDNYQQELPATGGIGTRGFTAVGITLMLVSVLLLGTGFVIKKRRY